MSTRAQRLSAYLSDAARRPFVWGAFDCCILIADWVALERGDDPMRSLRGAYDSEAGALALVEQAGGLLALVDDLAGRAGLSRTDAPEPGDIGIVMSRDVAAAAIRGASRWSALSPRGIAGWRTAPLMAWRV